MLTLSFDLHALVTGNGDEIESFVSSNTAQIGLHLPLGIEGKQIISEREDPIVDFDPLWAYRNGTKPEKGTVEKPYHQTQPDGKDHNVLWSLFQERMHDKKAYHTEKYQHYGVLDIEGFDDK